MTHCVVGRCKCKRVQQRYVFIACLLAEHPSKTPSASRDRSSQTVVRAATLGYELRVTAADSSSHSILTPGQLVPALNIYCWVRDKAASRAASLKSLV